MKLPHEILGISASRLAALEAWQKQEELLERTLGAGARELLESYNHEKEMLERYARPDLEIARNYQELHSGRSALRAAEEAARKLTGPVDSALAIQREAERMASPVRDIKEHLGLNAAEEAIRKINEPVERALAIQRDLERVANYGHELSTTYGLTAAEALMREARRATDGYETIAALVERDRHIEEHWRELAGHADLARALRVTTPWVNALEPARSIAAFGVASEVGDIVTAMSTGKMASLADLASTLGTWQPPADFTHWDESRRFEFYAHAGVDMRIFDLPRFAYLAIAREVGIAPPVEREEPPRDKRHGRARRRSLNDVAGERVKKIELVMRVEIARRGEAVYGPDWPIMVMPSSTLKRLQNAQARRLVGRSPHILDHSYFSDLAMIAAQPHVWERLFNDLAISPEEFGEALRYCVHVRNAVQHYVPIDQCEFNAACAAVARLMGLFDPSDEDGTLH